jgi:hypothetical protein
MLEAFTRSRQRARVFLFSALADVRVASVPLRWERRGCGRGNGQRALPVFPRRLHSAYEPTRRAAA